MLACLQRLLKSSNAGSLQELVHTTAWCEDPAILAWIRATAMRTKESYLIQEAMPAFAEPGNLKRRAELDKMLAQWRSRGVQPLQSILSTALTSHPNHAANVLDSVLRDCNHGARLACVGACGGMSAAPVAPLRPLLDDLSSGCDYYHRQIEQAQG